MITISCIDLRTKKTCEISIKDYSNIIFRKTIDDKNEKKDKYEVLLISEGVWYATPKEEFENHLEESDIEDSMELDINLDDDEAPESVEECEVK